jgi:hypothetical protein
MKLRRKKGSKGEYERAREKKNRIYTSTYTYTDRVGGIGCGVSVSI